MQKSIKGDTVDENKCSTTPSCLFSIVLYPSFGFSQAKA